MNNRLLFCFIITFYILPNRLKKSSRSFWQKEKLPPRVTLRMPTSFLYNLLIFLIIRYRSRSLWVNARFSYPYRSYGLFGDYSEYEDDDYESDSLWRLRRYDFLRILSSEDKWVIIIYFVFEFYMALLYTVCTLVYTHNHEYIKIIEIHDHI